MIKKFKVCLYKGNNEILNINDVIEIYFLPFAVHISNDYGFTFDFDYDEFDRIEVNCYD